MPAPPDFPKGFRIWLIVCFVCALSGCVQPKSPDGGKTFYATHDDMESFLNASPCCASMSEFHYQPLIVPSKQEVDIDEHSPAFTFVTGKSYFLAYSLPATSNGAQLTINSYFHGAVFFSLSSVFG